MASRFQQGKVAAVLGVGKSGHLLQQGQVVFAVVDHLHFEEGCAACGVGEHVPSRLAQVDVFRLLGWLWLWIWLCALAFWLCGRHPLADHGRLQVHVLDRGAARHRPSELELRP